jgi:hypothetical protein
MSEDAHELVCSGCGGPRDRGPERRYCRDCKNAYDRKWRKRQVQRIARLEAELLAASYGKNVSRETQDELEKRCKGLP